MNRVEITGKTVEEALRLALIQLDAEEKDVKYEILEEGSKGFLGFGSKEYRLLVERIESPVTLAEAFVSDILKNMGFDCTLESRELENEIRIEIFGEDIGLIIGKHGSTLDSIQYVTNLVVSKKFDNLAHIRLDVGGYREKRLEVLENMAAKLAARVRKTRKAVALEPMNAYERRIVHTFLQHEPGIGTKSEGNDPDRYIVIYSDRGGYRKKGKNFAPKTQ